MNAERLLALYNRVADAPDAINRLRRFILDLAVRGKLVEQAPADEPASELLKRIAAEKVRLVKELKIKKPKPLPPVEEEPFDLPTGWTWTRLGIITSYIQRGKSPKYATSDGSPVVSQKCVQWSGLDLSVAKRITRESLKNYEAVRFLHDGDLLWNSTGTGTIGRVIRLANPPDELVCDSHVTVVRCLKVDPEYIRLWLRTDHVYGSIEDRAAGSTSQIELTSEMANGQPVPLPPLAEQHRIVAKVDELMALCDRLEVAHTAREVTRDRLTAASLARLTVPETGAEDFHTDARFVLGAFPVLTTRPDQIQALRWTILDLAVRGKLVGQDPADEPASQLLKRIMAEKARLLRAGTIRKERPFLPLTKADGVFDLPDGWAWVRLGDLSQFVTSGSRDWAKYYSNEGAIFVRMGNLSKDHYCLRLDHIQRVKPPADGEGTRTRLEAGDILISITGEVGMLGLIPESFGEAYINQHTAMVRPMSEMKGRYLAELLRSPFAQDQFNEPQRGIKNSFRLTDVTQFVVPLPPLAEQHRIVAKVDALMALCDRLEASLREADNTRSRLLEALLHEALQPAARKLEAAE